MTEPRARVPSRRSCCSAWRPAALAAVAGNKVWAEATDDAAVRAGRDRVRRRGARCRWWRR